MDTYLPLEYKNIHSMKTNKNQFITLHLSVPGGWQGAVNIVSFIFFSSFFC